MRMRLVSLCLLLWLCSLAGLQAATAQILKVLPQYLDLEGRASLSPSLYERDAYQAYLGQHVELRSAMRFAVHWKGKGFGSDHPLLRLELRSSGSDPAKPFVLERKVPPTRLFRSWSYLYLEGQEYKKFGKLLAWRVSLWQDGQLLTEQKSFLW